MSDQPAIPPSYGPRQAQSIDDMLLQAGNLPGWQGFAPPDPKDRRGSPAEAVVEKGNLAAAAAARLMNDRAQPGDMLTLVEFLADISVRRPFFVLGMPEPALYAALREGQNGLFFSLLSLIAAGRQEQPTVREGT